MKRFLLPGVLGLLAVASIVLAQAEGQATLRTPSGDKPVAITQQNGLTYFSANDVVTALGGTIQPDSGGFRVTLNNTIAAFGPDTRFAVVRDDLIEMPVNPIVVAGVPFVPWQFFNGFLAKAAEQEVIWDSGARVLTVRLRQQSIVAVQMSVTNVQGISKIVLTLSAPSEYAIAKDAAAYVIRFKAPLAAPFAEQAYDDPNVAHASFSGSDVRIQLTSPDVAGDAYKLDNPFRIILDLRKAAAPVPGRTPQLPGIKPSVEPAGIRTIVIDPGHGGKEVGAVGPGGLMEKDITLAVARKLSAALQSSINARVVLTREDDTVVSLDQRTAIANQYKADLFLSIHMNAAVVKGAKGSETYFLSLEASDELAKRAAETENASTAAPKTGPTPDLKLILWDLAQQEYLQESSRFAQDIQEEMNAATNVQNRGVKQAPFKVLVGATMPAALVEVGFITNPEEEAKLKSDGFQDTMVDALVRAIRRYKVDYETRIGLVQPSAQPHVSAGVTKPAAPPQKGKT
ncbi:MAG TPA: N-acetylmuramoyl-L-alanine amidase [Thermoanaerobaculia bacterium]|nr:N-acetylmuramoyl-L-alanine amidase [Thermoanaerobaculia bacterium]